MSNAVKNIANFIRRNSESDDATVLWQLCKSLEAGTPFQMQLLFDLRLKSFEMAMELLDEWRIDRMIVERRVQKYLDLSED